MNEVKTYIREAEDKMNLSVAFLDEALASIRAGKANPVFWIRSASSITAAWSLSAT